MDLVECPECDQEFDPEAQDGWCTNAECGKYQYDPDDDRPDTGDSTRDDSIDNATDDPAKFCPSCGTGVGDDNFCPQCRHEFGSVSETQECSACHETVPQRTYCLNCGMELSTVVSPSPVCPSCDEDVDPDDNFCSECGESLDDDSPTELVLEFSGQEVDITDGKLVGAKLRDYAHDDGVDWNVARQIHREHVEFVATDSGFDLIAVDQERDRQNDTYLNGDKLAPGERESLDVGDEIGFHDVGTGVVRKD
jgi:predicted amidophosphoribosyltransferase